jgi:hypothetical protein
MCEVSGRFVTDVVSSYITLFSFPGAEIIRTSLAERQNALFIITFLFPGKVDSFYQLPDPVIRDCVFLSFMSSLFLECFLARNLEDRRRGQQLVREE